MEGVSAWYVVFLGADSPHECYCNTVDGGPLRLPNDIARVCSVSMMTLSRVLRGSSRVLRAAPWDPAQRGAGAFFTGNKACLQRAAHRCCSFRKTTSAGEFESGPVPLVAGVPL
jgi:hypothetical protein